MDLRAQIAEALRGSFDREVIREWICCDPIQPAHTLCQQGEAARGMGRALFTDDPDFHPPTSRVLDAVMVPVSAHVDTMAATVEQQRQEIEKLRADLESATSVQVWPLARVLTEVRCGSQDWTWEEEWADLDERHAATGYLDKLEAQIRESGITMPVLVGSDGRLWDGHHRLRIAVRTGIPYVPVEVVPRKQDAALERARENGGGK